METEELVRRYWDAVSGNDFETMGRLRHPEWHEDWPQSGERIPSHDAYQKIHEDFPAGMPKIAVNEVSGAEDRWVMTPSMTIARIAGSGDVWFMEGVNTYSGGDVYHIAQHIWLRDGRVWRSTTYFAAAFDAPTWRSSFVEPIK